MTQHFFIIGNIIFYNFEKFTNLRVKYSSIRYYYYSFPPLLLLVWTISFQLEIIQLSAAVNFNFILDAATVLNQVKNYSLGGLFLAEKWNLKMLQHEIQ